MQRIFFRLLCLLTIAIALNGCAAYRFNGSTYVDPVSFNSAVDKYFSECVNNVEIIKDVTPYKIAYIVPDYLFTRNKMVTVYGNAQTPEAEAMRQVLTYTTISQLKKMGEAIQKASGYKDIQVINASVGSNTAAEGAIDKNVDFILTVTHSGKILITSLLGEEKLYDPKWKTQEGQLNDNALFNNLAKGIHSEIKHWYEKN